MSATTATATTTATTSASTTPPISYKDAAAKSLKMNSPHYHHPSSSSSSQNGSPAQSPSVNGQQQAQQFPSGPNPYAQTVTGMQFQGLPFPQQPMTPQQQQQFAQWAYQQMMFQQQQLAFQPHAPVPFMTPQQMQVYQQQLLQQQQMQFPTPQPPYARERNGSASSVHSSSGGSVHHGRQRTTSNRSNATNATNTRARTNSSTGGGGGNARQRSASPGPQQPQHQPQPRHRVSSSASNSARPPNGSSSGPPSRTPSATSAAAAVTKPPAQKQHSGSSSASSKQPTSSTPTPKAAPSPPPNANGARPPAKPSPLSQAPTAATPEPVATPAMIKSGGLKGRLKRALSFSALDEHSTPNDPKIGSRKQAVNAKLAAEAIPRSTSQPLRPSMDAPSVMDAQPIPSSSSTTLTSPPEPSEGSIRSTTTATTAPAKKRSLFNSKFNRSTDNMSMASTASSASMMIRKLGSVGKLVRRNSLMGISKMFKKDNDEGTQTEGEGGKEDKKKKDKGRKLTKSHVAEPSVSHATAENEPASPAVDGDEPSLVGLSPAAKLARAHTLRSRAAEAAKAAEAKAAASASTSQSSDTPTTWEKNTATRSGGGASRKGVNDHGGAWTPPSEEDDDLSEDGSTFDAHHQSQQQWREHANQDDDSEEDEDFAHDGYGYDDEDETVRLGGGGQGADEGFEPWAVGLRRSVERHRTPAKGILRNAENYNQNQLLEGGQAPVAPFTRVRTNSNDSAPPMGAEPGPLTHIPSPDPDHIDGLHRSGSTASTHSRKLSTSSAGSGAMGAGGFLPAFNFGDSSDLESTLQQMQVPTNAKKDRPLSSQSSASIYANADFNASAPALHDRTNSSSNNKATAPSMGLRSATVPLTKNSKKLTFAANLSVYHTFSPSAYDRRSEPATCNRLTPVLAQRIKEELNSYKMEEMEVHPTSRVHTHFFV